MVIFINLHTVIEWLIFEIDTYTQCKKKYLSVIGEDGSPQSAVRFDAIYGWNNSYRVLHTFWIAFTLKCTAQQWLWCFLLSFVFILSLENRQKKYFIKNQLKIAKMLSWVLCDSSEGEWCKYFWLYVFLVYYAAIFFLYRFGVKIVQSVWISKKKKEKTYIAILDDDVVIGHLPIIVVIIVKCGV